MSNVLTTPDDLRRWLAVDEAAEKTGRFTDQALQDLIDRATAAINDYCGRVLMAPDEPQTFSLRGSGGVRMLLPEWPLLNLVSLTIDGQPIPARQGPGDLGYRYSSNEACIGLFGHVFTGDVVVVARCGFDRDLISESRRHAQAFCDLRQACLHLCSQWFWEPVAGKPEGIPLRQEEPWSAVVRGLLAPYRRLEG